MADGEYLWPRTGLLPSGPVDAITDVPGVRVGHCTLAEGAVQTGVTVITREGEDAFTARPLAACQVFNGFGKSMGLMQVAELGCLETPVALTNTLAVGTVATAQIRAALAKHSAIGRDWPTVNPLVLECNDGYLNDIRTLAVREEHYLAALDTAGMTFAQGSVGAGRGMSCFEVKGGIGSASRLVRCGEHAYVLGALVLSNFGKARQCLLAGLTVGPLLEQRLKALSPSADEPAGEQGSIIMVVATDAPLDALQLGRLSRRAGNGLARMGSVFGHGSGDVALAFSVAQTLPRPEPETPLALLRLPDELLDRLFQATVEAVEQAIIKALFLAESVTGRDGHCRPALPELLPERREWTRKTNICS